MFSVQLVYKTSVQKIELNQNEFPMKHTQVIYHTTIKNQRHPKHYNQSLQCFQEIYHTTIHFTTRMMTISSMHQEPKAETPWEAPSPEAGYSG